MNILFLEDRGSVAFYITEALESRGHDVFSACSVNEADSYLEEQQVDCLIVDLNMSPDGLDSDPEETNSGMFTGWIWLKKRVFAEKPELKGSTIVYSEYLDRFHLERSEEQLDGVVEIRKRVSGGGGVRRLLQEVESIAHRLRGNVKPISEAGDSAG